MFGFHLYFSFLLIQINRFVLFQKMKIIVTTKVIIMNQKRVAIPTINIRSVQKKHQNDKFSIKNIKYELQNVSTRTIFVLRNQFLKKQECNYFLVKQHDKLFECHAWALRTKHIQIFLWFKRYFASSSWAHNLLSHFDQFNSFSLRSFFFFAFIKNYVLFIEIEVRDMNKKKLNLWMQRKLESILIYDMFLFSIVNFLLFSMISIIRKLVTFS